MAEQNMNEGVGATSSVRFTGLAKQFIFKVFEEMIANDMRSIVVNQILGIILAPEVNLTDDDIIFLSNLLGYNLEENE